MTTADDPSAAGRLPDPDAPSLLVTAGWWAVALFTLVVVDDLTFGPVFWVISVVRSPLAGFLVALAIYVPAQVILVHEATKADPHRVAAFFLRRLELDRRFDQIAVRERRLRGRVTGAVTAVLLSPVVGGVLPPLFLWRLGATTRSVRHLSYVTALVYALVFAYLHGVVPGNLAGH